MTDNAVRRTIPANSIDVNDLTETELSLASLSRQEDAKLLSPRLTVLLSLITSQQKSVAE